MGGIVALLTRQLCVLPLESKSSESSMLIFLPVQSGERELPPVVLHVATHTIDLRAGYVINTAVVAGMLIHATADFSVTIQTL